MKYMRDMYRRVWRVMMAAAFFVAVAAAVLGANPFARQTVGPYDLLMSEKGWNLDLGPVPVRNRERTDILDAMVPRWMFARGELRQGRVPLWNPLTSGGEAGIHNLASAQLSPAFAIFAAAPSPASGFYLATLFNLAMTGLGAWLWLRRSLSTLPALFGGVTVMLCGFNAAWLYWPHMSTAVWVCWLLWAVQGWWIRPSPWRFLAVVVATMLLLVGGFPFVAELGLGAAGLFALVLWYSTAEPGVKRMAGIVAAIVLGAGLVAIPLLSFAGWLAHVDTAARAGGSPLRLVPDALLLMPHFAHQRPLVEAQMYVGSLVLPLSLLALLQWIKPRNLEPVLVFASLLLASALVLVFQLVPTAWLAWVPGLGGNTWSRSILILDLALAALAACGLAWVLRRMTSRVWILVLVLPLIAVQTLDLGNMFRRFNGPVSSAWMFPPTPQIALAQGSLSPFNYVIADANYIVSGSLGAYGLAEWYGHGFKAPAVKKLLAQAVRDPFTTATASVIEPSAVMLDSPAIRAMAVRYVFGDERLLASTWAPEYREGPAPMQALPALAHASWVQYVDLPHRFGLTNAEFRIATYGGSGLHGTLTLTVSEAGALHNVIAESTLPAASLVDGDMANFSFHPEIDLAGGRYTFALRYDGAAADENITAWYRPGAPANCSLQVEPVHPPGCLIMRLLSARSDLRGWRVVSNVHGLVLLENLNAPRGAYFIASLADVPGARSADVVDTTGNFSEGWTLRYTDAQPGYVVVPMHATRSWRFAVDGNPVQPQRYLGVLPAIAVDGVSTVTVRYQSISVHQGRWIMLAAGLILLLVVLVLHRRRLGTGA